jgi:adenylate cyclase
MAKILVVDDEQDLVDLIQQKFRKKIRSSEYEFIFANNGQNALLQLESFPDVDVILSDINMPVMDGLTLLTHVNDKHSLLKTVMVSAYGDMDNIRTAMNRGAFDFITKPVNFEDLELTIDKTIRHVIQTKKNIKALKENNILKMYVNETVLNFMGSREFEESLTANELIEATVVFIDICQFTKFSSTESPDTVVKMLNRYFELMVKEILAQGGQVDKFMGDAVMAIFKGEDHLQNAIKTALSIVDQVSGITEPVEGKPEYQFEMSIGINTGEMISGNIGSASLKRLDYTVIGDSVNLAQRLQSAAAPSQILITNKTYQMIKDQFTCHEVGEINLKNISQPTSVYEVKG